MAKNKWRNRIHPTDRQLCLTKKSGGGKIYLVIVCLSIKTKEDVYMKNFKRVAATALSAVMALGVMNFTVFAEGKAVAKIGDVEYETLNAAVKEAQKEENKGCTVEVLDDIEENGIAVQSGSDFTIDFNGNTYTIDGTVGSSGTETNGLQLLKGSDITLKDGTIESDTAYVLIQNYCNLTLIDMNLKGGDNCQYVISNNCGDTVISGETNITAREGWYAFDLYYWPDNGYGEGVSVTFDEDMTGKVEGKVEYGSDSTATEEDCVDKAKLNIENGNFDIEIKNNLKDEKPSINIKNGTFTTDIEEYLDEDSHLVKDEDGNYVAMDDKAFEESEKTFYINDVDDLELAVKNQADGVTWIFTGEDYEIDSTILITSDIIIEGNGSTIKVRTDISGEPNGSNSAIEIENGANVVINNISIDGNQNVKHGINIFTAQGEDKVKVELNGVSIEDCKGYGVVNNASDLTVTDISTSGNGWGGINVDNSKSAGTDGASITINGGKIDEDNSLYFENANAEAGTTIDAVIKDGTFEGNVTVAGNNADVTIEDGKFNGKVEVTEDSNSDLTIENGKFTNDVSEYLDEDSHLVKDEDGNYIAMDEETYEDYLDDNKSHGSSFELEEKENNRKDDDDKDKEEDKKPEEPEEESIFSDVAIDDPNYDAIVKVFEKGWMVGVSEKVFAPNGTLTRGMAATILWNKAGKPEPVNAAPFLDVTADAWYAKAVAWAYEQGIVLGYDAETFGPNDFVTTEQFTIMLDKSEGKTPAPYAGGAPNATRAWVASKIA